MGWTYPEIASYIPNTIGARIVRNVEHMVSYVLTRNAAWVSVSQGAQYWKQTNKGMWSQGSRSRTHALFREFRFLWHGHRLDIIDAHVFLCENRPFIISADTHAINYTWRTCDLLDGAREPIAGADSPESERVEDDDPNGDGRIVERLRVDRVQFWEAKDDRDECDPEYGSDGDWVRELPEVERSSYESVCIDHAQGDGQSY